MDLWCTGVFLGLGRGGRFLGPVYGISDYSLSVFAKTLRFLQKFSRFICQFAFLFLSFCLEAIDEFFDK